MLVAAVGRAKMIRGRLGIKPGAAVIDVGMNRDEAGKLCGRRGLRVGSERSPGCITPVPGGVGPMTIAMLLENTLLAARARIGANATQADRGRG